MDEATGVDYHVYDIRGNKWTVVEVESVEVDLRGLLRFRRFPHQPDRYFGIGTWITYHPIELE